MISLIIPALNESATIGLVVPCVRRDPAVFEVIVAEDGSIDGTPELAHAGGVTVVTSSIQTADAKTT